MSKSNNEELVESFVNEFEGLCPEQDTPSSRFFGFAGHDEAPGWYEKRQARRERINELRRRSYYQASLALEFFQEYSKGRLVSLLGLAPPPATDQERALYDASVQDALSNISARMEDARMAG